VLDDPIARDFIIGRNDQRECPAVRSRRIGGAGGLERGRERGRDWILAWLHGEG